MLYGYELFYQKNLTEQEIKISKLALNLFINDTMNINENLKDDKILNLPDYSKSTRGGHSSFFNRYNLGISCFNYIPKTMSNIEWYDKNIANNLILRRVSKNKRLFAIVKLEELKDIENNINLCNANMCHCPKCFGGIKVTWKTKRPELVSYARIGNISG